MSINTPADLRAYASLPTTLLDATLQLYLDAANIIVVQDLSGSGYDASRLKLIELNLAAHFATNGPANGSYSSGMMQSIKVGQSEERYVALNNGQYGLATSVYGQIAMALDTMGILAGLMASKPLKAQFRVV